MFDLVNTNSKSGDIRRMPQMRNPPDIAVFFRFILILSYDTASDANSALTSS